MLAEYKAPEHSPSDINRLIPSRYRLHGVRCKSCGSLWVTKRAICPECKKVGEFEEVPLSGKGKVLNYTVVRVPLLPIIKQGAYAVGIVELEEGTKAEGQIVDIDPNDVHIGMKVETTMRKIRQEHPSIDIYMYKFKPATS